MMYYIIIFDSINSFNVLSEVSVSYAQAQRMFVSYSSWCFVCCLKSECVLRNFGFLPLSYQYLKLRQYLVWSRLNQIGPAVQLLVSVVLSHNCWTILWELKNRTFHVLQFVRSCKLPVERFSITNFMRYPTWGSWYEGTRGSHVSIPT